MTNDEILSRFEPNCEYPSYYYESNIEQAIDLARQDAREQVINELVGWMEEQSSPCWVKEPSADEVFTMCIHKAKSLLNQQGEETKLNP